MASGSSFAVPGRSRLFDRRREALDVPCASLNGRVWRSAEARFLAARRAPLAAIVPANMRKSRAGQPRRHQERLKLFFGAADPCGKASPGHTPQCTEHRGSCRSGGCAFWYFDPAVELPFSPRSCCARSPTRPCRGTIADPKTALACFEGFALGGRDGLPNIRFPDLDVP